MTLPQFIQTIQDQRTLLATGIADLTLVQTFLSDKQAFFVRSATTKIADAISAANEVDRQLQSFVTLLLTIRDL